MKSNKTACGTGTGIWHSLEPDHIRKTTNDGARGSGFW